MKFPKLLLWAVLAASCLWSSSFAAPAFDAETGMTSNSSAGATSASWTHTPVGTPRGVLVFINELGTADIITGVTYGGVTMTRVEFAVESSSGGRGTYLYFLGASIPTGAQTVQVTISPTGSERVLGRSLTLTASNDTEINAFEKLELASGAANPSETFEIGGVESFVVQGFIQVAATELSGWTARSETTWANLSPWQSDIYTYDTVGTSDVTYGYTSTGGGGAHTALVVVAVAEQAVAGAPAITSTSLLQSGKEFTVTGTDFSGSGNTLLICPTDDIDDVNCESQTITTETTTTVEAASAVLPTGADPSETQYAFVTNASMLDSDPGFAVLVADPVLRPITVGGSSLFRDKTTGDSITDTAVRTVAISLGTPAVVIFDDSLDITTGVLDDIEDSDASIDEIASMAEFLIIFPEGGGAAEAAVVDRNDD